MYMYMYMYMHVHTCICVYRVAEKQKLAQKAREEACAEQKRIDKEVVRLTLTTCHGADLGLTRRRSF